MRAKALVALLALNLVVAGVIAIGADDPIASLNRSIQDRFKDVDKYFGLRRIVVIGDTPHQFRPESVAEFAAVKELKESGLPSRTLPRGPESPGPRTAPDHRRADSARSAGDLWTGSRDRPGVSAGPSRGG